MWPPRDLATDSACRGSADIAGIGRVCYSLPKDTFPVYVTEDTDTMIAEQAVIDAQEAWVEGIVAIDKVHADGGDYAARATKHINDLYAYGETQGHVQADPGGGGPVP